MKVKIIGTLVFGLFAFVLYAQEKYEYSTVVYYAVSKKEAIIAVSQNGNYTKTEVEVSEGAPAENLTPVLDVVNKMNAEGWEVYANSILPPAMGGNLLLSNFHAYYFLKKKKN